MTKVPFDFSMSVEKASWLVEGLIPLGHLIFFLAQSGVGKSLIVEALAVHTICEKPFCGMEVNYGDVLIIDQDTPTNVLQNRLVQFYSGLQAQPKHELFVESMNEYNLSDKTLITLIGDYPTAKLVIVDSFHSVCGKLNPASTADMSVLSRLKGKCLNEQKTIIFNHHISEKKDVSIQVLMSADPHQFAMNSSVIIQQADSYFIVGADAQNGRTNKVYLRPVSKRLSIAKKPLIMKVVTPDSGVGEYLDFDSYYEPELSVAEVDIIMMFREIPKERTVKEVYDELGHKHGENQVRKALATLDDRGSLVVGHYKSNLFKYRLP